MTPLSDKEYQEKMKKLREVEIKRYKISAILISSALGIILSGFFVSDWEGILKIIGFILLGVGLTFFIEAHPD